MVEGIYSITFRGSADWGIGMLLFQRGIILGADVSGVQFDGVYRDDGEALHVDLTMAVPPGVMLVMGGPPQSKPYSIPVEAKVPKICLETQEPLLLNLPPGPVNVIFKRLRKLGA